MNESMHEGIVLKSFVPYKQKLSLFDARLGKIEGIPQGSYTVRRLPQGALVHYNLRKWNEQYMLSDANIISIPEHMVQHNFFFFHHVLELCYQFLPYDCQAEDLFALIIQLFKNDELIDTAFKKKLFLCHLFARMGIYPEHAESHDFVMRRLISSPHDDSLEALDTQVINQHLDTWLLQCIHVHPYASTFKTIHIIKKLGIHE